MADSKRKLTHSAGDIDDILDSADTHIDNQSNPHGVTKVQVGLGNVENKSSAAIRSEITASNVTSALGFTPLNANSLLAQDYSVDDPLNLWPYRMVRYTSDAMRGIRCR